MRTETVNYGTQRKKYVTAPNMFLRLYHVPTRTTTQEWAFSRDFTAKPVLNATVPKLAVLVNVQGNTQTVDPIAGTSSIGALTITLADVDGEITKYVSDPARPLTTSIDADDTTVVVDDATGYPAVGHIRIDDEDMPYTSITGGNTFNLVGGGSGRGQRGTTAAAHTAGALVRNGEQIRQVNRGTLFLGYDPLQEVDYGPGSGYVKMEIHSVRGDSLAWVLQLFDVQRFARRKVFERASERTPVTLGPDHPLNIALKVITSTGAGVNGAYDVYASENGAAVPNNLVSLSTLEFLRDNVFPGLQMLFTETEPQDAKQWVEEQIFRPLNLVPFITQSGRYAAAVMRTPEFVRAMVHAAVGVGV